MKNKLFWLWLSALVIPVLILIGAQIDINPKPSIGGGGYDLGPFLYSWLMIIVTAVWSLCTLVVAIFHRNRATRRRYLRLTVVGIITLAAILLFFGNNLS